MERRLDVEFGKCLKRSREEYEQGTDCTNGAIQVRLTDCESSDPTTRGILGNCIMNVNKDGISSDAARHKCEKVCGDNDEVSLINEHCNDFQVLDDQVSSKYEVYFETMMNNFVYDSENETGVIVNNIFFQHGAVVGVSSDNVQTFFRAACEYGQRQLVKNISTSFPSIDAQDGNRTSALMLACGNGHRDIVDLLIKHKADIHAVDKAGKSPLFFAVENERAEIVEMLLSCGAGAKDIDMNGITVLMYACKTGNPDTVRLLLHYGACVYTTSPFCGTAFIQTCCHGDTSVLNLLLQYGADPNEGRGGDVTPLLTACQMGREDILEFLVQNGAYVNATHQGGKSILMLISKLDNITSHTNIIQILFRYGADANAADINGTTVLMSACSSGQDSFVELLLRRGVDFNVQCNSGKTAAMHAAKCGSVKTLKNLVRFGANLDLISKDGCTVLSYAMNNETSLDCIRFLLEDGQLVQNGQLKNVHKTAWYPSCSLESIKLTIDVGVFEWRFCSTRHFKPVFLAAMKTGICPGSVPYHDKIVSPLGLTFLENDLEAMEVILTNRYYFLEDYKSLACKVALKTRVKYSAHIIDETIRKPLSLFTLSYLTVSKAISMSGPHNSRCQRVDALLVPELIKKTLKFQN